MATLTGFVDSAHQLYIIRFLLGVAEASFFPGIVLYLTYWFSGRTGAGHDAVHGRLARDEYPRSAAFGAHPRSVELVEY
jgi:MFS family permease